jgi:hypothetical protein
MIITLNKQSILRLEGRLLLPGPNQVDASWWKSARGLVPEKLTGRSPEIVEEQDIDKVATMSKEEEKKADVNLLKKMKPQQAINLVAQTTQVPVLEAWLKVEKRTDVKTAITEQIEMMNTPLEDRDRSKPRTASGEIKSIEINLESKPGSKDD